MKDRRLVPFDDNSLLEILHFPMRSYQQFENKIAKGGAAYVRNTREPVTIGITWRRLYEVYRAGGLRGYYESHVLSDQELRDGLAAGRLVFDDRVFRVVAGAERHHSSHVESSTSCLVPSDD